ncbi:peptidase M23 family protein [Burkholderia mallei]|nr:peptidase M23 family protein [Burkholderia mallei]
MIRSFDGSKSKGIDIANTAGTPVIAAAAGTVVYAGNGLRGYGNLLIVKHDADFLTTYAHNRALLVKEGQTVAQGQKIAEMGDTDNDRVALHFELRYGGRSIDPARYLPSR